jgi:hypothetical protein
MALYKSLVLLLCTNPLLPSKFDEQLVLFTTNAMRQLRYAEQAAGIVGVLIRKWPILRTQKYSL